MAELRTTTKLVASIPIRVTKGEHIYADHVTVTFNDEVIEHWHEADEINSWLFIYSDKAQGADFGKVVIALNDDAPEDVREAYELARTPAHLRR